MNNALPKEANPRQIEKNREPNAIIVVKVVRSMAFPVLANTV